MKVGTLIKARIMNKQKNLEITSTFLIFSIALLGSSTFLPVLSKTNAPVSVSREQVPSEEQFMKMLSQKVQKIMNANPPKDVKEATQAVLIIKLDKSGKLDEVKIDQSSGNEQTDEVALQSVKKAAPFGRLPLKFGDGLALKYTFRFAASKAPASSPEEKAKSDEYMKKVQEKIRHFWRSPDVPVKCQTTLVFTIEKSGNIKSVQVKKSSGNKTVDAAALDAIKKAAPFESLPDVWKEGFAVEYNLAAGPKNEVKHYKFNDVNLPDGDYQISRGGAKLHPLEFNKNIENKLQDHHWELEEKLKSLDDKLKILGTDEKTKSDLLHKKGKTLIELKKYSDAISALDQAASGLAPEADSYVYILYDLAEAHRLNNANESACIAYQKCIDTLKARGITSGAKLDTSKLKEAMTGLAKTLYKQNKTKEAEAIYAEIRALK